MMKHDPHQKHQDTRSDSTSVSLSHWNQSIDDQIYEFNNSCSSTDCTGLIPAAPVEDGALESYEALYPYLPPDYGINK